MKKLLFGMAFMGAMMFSSLGVVAQVEEEPCPPGSPTNSYGGVCCASSRSCPHPYAGLIAASSWTSCVSTCS